MIKYASPKKRRHEIEFVEKYKGSSPDYRLDKMQNISNFTPKLGKSTKRSRGKEGSIENPGTLRKSRIKKSSSPDNRPSTDFKRNQFRAKS